MIEAPPRTSRGRPSAASLTDLRDNLTAERFDGIAFASQVAGVANEIHTAMRLGNEQRVMERAGFLNSASLRFIGRRSSGTL